MLMVVDQARGFVFVHNPKAAGQSLSRALGGHSPQFELHTPLRVVDRGPLFAFGVVRNPWRRLVSLYRFMCRKPMRPSDAFDQELVRGMGFERWLCEHRFFMQQDDRSIAIQPMQRRSQRFWLEGADQIIRFERLEPEAREIFEQLGLRWHGVPQTNADPNPADYRCMYGSEAKRHVQEWFGWEIEECGYVL